jgi:hypothetical protein
MATTTSALPTTLGLRIDRVGDLSLPMSEFHVRAVGEHAKLKIKQPSQP